MIGRQWKTRPFLDKSLGGSIAFAISAMGVALVYTSIYDLSTSYVVSACVAAVVSAVVEAASVTLKMDDNISIPFSFAITLMIAEWWCRFIGADSFIFSLP